MDSTTYVLMVSKWIHRVSGMMQLDSRFQMDPASYDPGGICMYPDGTRIQINHSLYDIDGI